MAPPLTDRCHELRLGKPGLPAGLAFERTEQAMNWELFAAFLLITVILLLTPGPIVTLVIATSASKGLRAALVTVAGSSTGNAVLVGAIALGLGYILENAVALFDAMRLIGAAYLIWLGIQAWRGAGRAAPASPELHRQFWRGFLVALSNPKTIAFFTAFLPQFVDPALPAPRQLAVMCAVSVVLGTLTDSGWAVLAGLGRAWLMQTARAKLLGRLSGLALIGGGIWLSLARRPA
jgi:homoserine/homoserine lactone efflux protein